MNPVIKEQIQTEIDNLHILQRALEKMLVNAPGGTVSIKLLRKKYKQFYLTEKGGKRRYLRNSQSGIVQPIIQREYNEKLLQEVLHEKAVLLQFLEEYNPEILLDIYEAFPDLKKEYVTPYILPDDLFLQNWYEALEGEKNPVEIADPFSTEGGQQVRSKSEKMIADKYLFRKIPYVYEAPLRLSDGGTVYPDFTILNVRTRKTIYHEHLGMIDNEEYCRKALLKLDRYAKSNIIMGRNLIITMEGAKKPFDTQILDSLIAAHMV